MAEEYPSNSLKSKEEKTEEPREKVAPVTTGAVVKKQSELKKFARNFVAEDAEHVQGYLFKDVLVPIVKNTIQQLVTKGIDYILYGESGSGKASSTVPKVSYGSYYNGSAPAPAPSKSSGFNIDDIILPTREDAEQVRNMMYELLERYHVVRVADYYDMCQITAPYTANRYGWKDIGECPVARCGQGFMLRLPRAIVLDN